MKKRILAAVLALMMICSLLPMTVLAEESGEGTPVPTETVSPVPTETVSPVPTETVSPVPTETVSPVPTETVSPVPTETVSPVPTETVSPVPTETVSPVPTETVTPTPVATQTPDRGPLMLAPAPNPAAVENAQLYAVKDGKIMTELNICIWNGLYVQLYYGDPSDGYDNDIAVNNAVLEGNASLGNPDHTDNGYQINPYKCQMNTASLKYQVDESTTATLAIHGLPKFGAILLEYNNELFDTEYKNIPVGMGGIYAGLYFCDQNGNTVKLTNTSGVTSTDVTVLNYIAEGDNAGKWQIAMSEPNKDGTITYKVGETTYSFIVAGAIMGPPGGGPSGPGGPGGGNGIVVNYSIDGVEVPITVGFGLIEQETMHIGVTNFGDSYTDSTDYGFEFTLALAALSNAGTNQEAVAPSDFYNCISDVYFLLGECSNEDGTTEPLNCTMSDTTPRAFAGINTWEATLSAPAKKGFDAEIVLLFTITLPGQEPVEYVLKGNGFYHAITQLWMEATAEEIPDAATLNQILSSYQSLMDWASKNRTADWQAWNMDGRTGEISLVLPPVTYTDVIVCATEDSTPDEYNMIHSGIWLYGYTDESGNKLTKMPGLVVNGGLAGVQSVAFDGSMSNANGTGIWVNGGEGFAQNDLVHVGWNEFLNLDYGIRSTGGGWAGGVFENVFRNCKNGIYINCEGDQGESGNSDFGWNAFYNCKNAAVVIEDLPNGVTPYAFRIHDSIFVDNAQDFCLDGKAEPGIYYFYLNFYGKGNKGKVEPRTVILGNKANAKIVTNPCYADIEMTKVMIDNTEGLYAWILPDMANALVIDGDMLKQNQGETEIALLNDNEEIAAVWTFGGNE